MLHTPHDELGKAMDEIMEVHHLSEVVFTTASTPRSITYRPVGIVVREFVDNQPTRELVVRVEGDWA